jgi:Fe2+ or Zn2+ uptake regulation protein
VTAQRVAVFRAVLQDLSHPTADAVHRAILADLGSMSLATVYRTLEFLAGGGLLRRVSTPESVSRFDANLAPHQHLVCRGCGRMRDWDEAALHRVRLPRRSFAGFRPEMLDIRIVGLCEGCARGAGPPLTRTTGR